MVNRSLMQEILALSPAERIQLVEDIWDSLAEFPESIMLTDAQARILEERLRELRDNPQAGLTWKEVKARILQKA
jgi:putative addiction module component (TIGR02574 family)